MDDQPRAQYYLFAHRMIPSIFFQDPEKFLATLSEHGMPFLRFLWDRVVQGLADQPVYPAQGLDFKTRGLEDGTRIVAISLPEPERMTEAHLIAPVYRPAQGDLAALTRYFTLEYGFSFADQVPRTVLCEWTPDQVHRNYGDGPEPTADAFLTVIAQKLTGKD